MTSCPPQPPRPRSEWQGQRTEAREWSSLAPTKTRAHSCPCSTDAPAEPGGSAAWSHQPVRGLGSSAALPGPPSPEVPSHSGQTEAKSGRWPCLDSTGGQRTRIRSRPPVSPPGAPPCPEARPAPPGHAPPAPCDSSAPLHASAAHGDLAGPQAVAELGGDGDEAGAQAPGSTRLGVDEGLHEAAEFVQGVDGANQLRGAHARMVRAHPPAPSLLPQSSPPIKLHHSSCLPHSVTGVTEPGLFHDPCGCPTSRHSALTVCFRPHPPI